MLITFTQTSDPIIWQGTTTILPCNIPTTHPKLIYWIIYKVEINIIN